MNICLHTPFASCCNITSALCVPLKGDPPFTWGQPHIPLENHYVVRRMSRLEPSIHYLQIISKEKKCGNSDRLAVKNNAVESKRAACGPSKSASFTGNYKLPCKSFHLIRWELSSHCGSDHRAVIPLWQIFLCQERLHSPTVILTRRSPH